MKKEFTDQVREVSRHNLSDSQSAFFARELSSVKAKSYDKKYADLPFRTLFPVTNETPAGSETIVIQSYDAKGQAKIINGYANDLPRVEVSGSETIIPVKQTGVAYGYSTKEIRSSEMVGKRLPQRKADMAARVHEELLNDIAFNGDADSKLLGLFTYPGIPSASVVNPGSGTEWVNKTPDQILFDMNDAVATVMSTTKMAEKPNTMILPVEQYQLISSLARSANSDTTVLEYFKRNRPDVEVLPVNELDSAGTGGVDVMVVYDRDPMVVQFEEPMPIMHLAPQAKDLGYEIPCEGENAGLSIYYPLAFSISEGI